MWNILSHILAAGVYLEEVGGAEANNFFAECAHSEWRHWLGSLLLLAGSAAALRKAVEGCQQQRASQSRTRTILIKTELPNCFKF